MLDQSDSVGDHMQDTLVTGAGLCDKGQVERIISASSGATQWLLEQEASFTRQVDQQLHLTREGGHGRRQIAHAVGRTGLVIMQTLPRS